MNFQFELPRSNKELLDDANCSNYFVKQIYNADEIPAFLSTASQALKASDAFYIFDHFDVFFSVIENVSQLQITHSMRAIDILYRTVDNLGQLLEEYLKQESLDRQNDFLNLIKMVMYLLVSSVRAVDSFIKKNVQESSTGGRKGKKKADEQVSHLESYETKRYNVLLQVYNIMQLPIEKLWTMSTIDEDFVNLLCDLAYRSLTRPSSKENHVNDAIFRILGIAIKQYRHSVAFPIQIIQIMDREESAVIPIANGVRYLYDELGERSSVMSKLLTELIDKMNGNPSQILPKNLSQFITEIGLISPELSLQCLEMAPDLLNLEAYVVRNSLFGIMNTIIVNHLCGEDLNDDMRTLRDECLEDLYNHMNDINSYVRSKVLQVWNDLKNKNAVPLSWIHPVVSRTVERLEDKTATVRKNAIILLRSYLESNPFSSKLQTDTIQEKLNMEKKRMDVIREKSREQYRSHDETQSFYDDQCVPQLNDIFHSILSDEQRTNALLADGRNINTSESSERVQAIRDLLKNGNLDQVAEYIIQLDGKVGHELEWKKMNVNEQTLYFVTLLRTYLFDDFESALEQQQSIIAFLEEAFQFTTTMTQAVPKLEQMLLSTTMTDVLEVIEFFKTGYLFNIKGTENGMRLMLRLLYISTGQDKNEKGEAVIKAYHSILFGTDATGRAHHLKVVDNLYKFIENITTGEHSAFEQMIKHWVLNDEINIDIINALFERFTLKLPSTSSDFSRCCLELLILVSNAKPAVANSNVKLITDILSSRRISEDPRIFVGCLKLLMNKVQPMDQKGNKINKISGYYPRFEDKDVITSIINTFKTFFFYPKLPDFEAIATQTIDFVYKMCNTPDLLGQEIIHDICKKLNGFLENKRAERMSVDSGVELPQPTTEIQYPKYLLPRIIYIFGYIATKELVFLDNDVYLNVKYREELHKKDGGGGGGDRTFESDGSFHRRANGLVSPNAAEAQENVYLGATAEDAIADTITNICDNELIGSTDGLFHHFVPIIEEILTHPAKYPDQYLQRAAVLTFMRFMAVSSRFCADKIAFLMNILKKTKSSSMKCNIVIGLADLTSRFTNTIEPWQPIFYTMLLEADQLVRLTSLKMLSYMLLQGIIRVTGEASDMAGCVVDDDLEIQNIAKEFFRQLIASKELEFYKILPDIVSRLSSNDTPIAEDKFQTILKYLLDLIHKDRHMESLVDKLCGRFRTTNTERQWRDVAFCLSRLNHSEKTMKKLLEKLPNYKDKIPIDGIYDCFKTIIANANKQIQKPELKNLAKELDTKLDKCLRLGANANVSMDDTATEDADDEPVPPVKAKGTKPRGKENRNAKRNGTKNVTKAKRGQSRRRKLSSSEESSSDDDFEDEAPAQRGRKR